MSDEEKIEQQIQEKGLNAPRLNPEHIQAQVKSTAYYVFPGTTTTLCCLTLRNGYTVIGKSACVSPENFDKEIGKKIALNDALTQVWQLEGYLLREQLHQSEKRA